LNDHPQTLDITLAPEDNQRLANLCGQLDEHLRLLESELGVEISNRGNAFRIIGKPGATQLAGRVLRQLYSEAGGGALSRDQVRLAVREALGGGDGADSVDETEVKIRHFRGSGIRPRGVTQKRYIKNITSCDINFGIGPAGTGKTYLAVACAVEALEREQVQRILYEMLGFERVMKLIERNIIEVAPLAYMRGRTLNDAFIILDEAQNATIEQMKMFLTRTGFGSTVVVTGDITQIDLPRNQVSGLRQIVPVLKDIEGVSFTFFQACDVVRHPLVQRIVEAYDQYESGANRGATDSTGND